jgi:hypothetical protein
MLRLPLVNGGLVRQHHHLERTGRNDLRLADSDWLHLHDPVR